MTNCSFNSYFKAYYQKQMLSQYVCNDFAINSKMTIWLFFLFALMNQINNFSGVGNILVKIISCLTTVILCPLLLFILKTYNCSKFYCNSQQEISNIDIWCSADNHLIKLQLLNQVKSCWLFICSLPQAVDGISELPITKVIKFF